MMLITLIQQTSLLSWATDHLEILKWPSIVLVIWRASRFLTQLESRAEAAEHHIIKMATNDLPHVGDDLKNIRVSNESIDHSLKILVERLGIDN